MRTLRVVGSACCNRLSDPVEFPALPQDLGCSFWCRHLRITVPCQRDQSASQTSIESPRREWRDTRGLNAAVEGLVERRKPLEMRTIAWAVDVEDCHHQPRPIRVAANATGRL